MENKKLTITAFVGSALIFLALLFGPIYDLELQKELLENINFGMFYTAVYVGCFVLLAVTLVMISNEEKAPKPTKAEEPSPKLSPSNKYGVMLNVMAEQGEMPVFFEVIKHLEDNMYLLYAQGRIVKAVDYGNHWIISKPWDAVTAEWESWKAWPLGPADLEPNFDTDKCYA